VSLHALTAERVALRLRTGSSSPVVVDTPGGTFVAKLRGAGQGVPALIAEIIVAEIAEHLGLPVPERVLIELPAGVRTDDRNDELADLLQRSVGLNLGFRYLDGARDPRPEELAALDDDFAARVLWLDGLTMNPDRTRRNPNILLWKKRPWLIDHGAALTFHHAWKHVAEDSPREPGSFAEHVFVGRLALLERFDPTLARLVTPEVLEACVAAVPDAFLLALHPEETPFRARAAYHAFLWKRLKATRPFVQIPPS
jgi:hypothetical protein